VPYLSNLNVVTH